VLFVLSLCLLCCTINCWYRKTEDLVYDLAFHPSVLDDCLKDSQLMDMLLGLCLDYIDNEVDLCLQDRKNCKRVCL